MNNYWKSVLCLSMLLFVFTTNASTIDEEIAKLRIEFNEQRQQQQRLKKLTENKEITQAYIEDFKRQEQCKKLGIDCKTGKPLKNTIQNKLDKISSEQKLIDAKLALAKKKNACREQGIDCDIGDAVTEKTKIKLPKKPKLIGFFNNYALFLYGDTIKKYAVGDKLTNNYIIKNIVIGGIVKLGHKDSNELIDIEIIK